MRSVVVVLPASMWAMIPMLRVRASGNSLMTGPSFAMFVLLSTYGCTRPVGSSAEGRRRRPSTKRVLCEPPGEQSCLSDWADADAGTHPTYQRECENGRFDSAL